MLSSFSLVAKLGELKETVVTGAILSFWLKMLGLEAGVSSNSFNGNIMAAEGDKAAVPIVSDDDDLEMTESTAQGTKRGREGGDAGSSGGSEGDMSTRDMIKSCLARSTSCREPRSWWRRSRSGILILVRPGVPQSDPTTDPRCPQDGPKTAPTWAWRAPRRPKIGQARPEVAEDGQSAPTRGKR